MAMLTTDADILALRPSMRATMADTYRQIEAENRRLYAESRAPRYLAEAEYAAGRAAMLEHGAPSLSELFQ